MLIAPLLAPAFLSLSNQNCTIFISIALIFNLLITVFSNIGIEFSWQFLFSGWVFYFYLGSCVERYFDVSLFPKVISAATLISFLVTVILSLAGISGKIYDYSPLYAIYSVGIYYALIRLRRDIIGKSTIFDDFVCFLAKHSFVMYLAHMTLIDKITKLCQSLFFNLNPLVHYICLSSFVFLSTLIVSVLLNTFIIDPLVKYSVDILRIRNS